MGAESFFFVQKAKEQELILYKEYINGVDLITCGAFLYFTLRLSTSPSLSTSLSASAV